MEHPARPARKVAIADHIWDAFEDMAREMGADRDGLINQAMFMFARLNGFLDGGMSTSRNSLVGASQPRVPVAVLQPVERAIAPAPEAYEPRPLEMKGNDGAAAAGPAELLGDDHADEPGLDARPPESPPPAVAAAPPSLGPDAAGLYLLTETGQERVAKERYVIGRGKHCDLVINSGKVSREHAAIVQDRDGWYLEDLGSSNGTWFNKQRIQRRKIEDGDEYFVCSERLRFALR
jgi:hypothetical protein